MLLFSSFIDCSPLFKDLLTYPAVPLGRGQEVDSAMAVLVVVPMDKLLAPLPRLVVLRKVSPLGQKTQKQQDFCHFCVSNVIFQLSFSLHILRRSRLYLLY